MKVNETTLSAVPNVASKAAQGAEQKEVAAKGTVKDKVSVTTPQQQAAIDGASASIASTRSARVQEIVSAVRSGQYYPSPQQIAQKLVSEAEVEARLRAMLAS